MTERRANPRLGGRRFRRMTRRARGPRPPRGRPGPPPPSPRDAVARMECTSVPNRRPDGICPRAPRTERPRAAVRRHLAVRSPTPPTRPPSGRQRRLGAGDQRLIAPLPPLVIRTQLLLERSPAPHPWRSTPRAAGRSAVRPREPDTRVPPRDVVGRVTGSKPVTSRADGVRPRRVAFGTFDDGVFAEGERADALGRLGIAPRKQARDRWRD